jgi:outer membrane lipoprotein-sorting protein
MKKRLTILLSLLPLFAAEAQLPDAGQIMTISRELSLPGSMSSIITLSITEKNGTVRKRIISMISESYPDGSEKRIIKFIEPPEVKGTGLLITDNQSKADEMWIYLPALKRTRRMISSDKCKSFMSSEFSNSDMSSPSISDFTYKHLETSGENGQWIIESTPANSEKADEYGCSKRISFINQDNWQLKKLEYYNFDNQLYKTMTVKSVQILNKSKYLIKNMVVFNTINGRSSEIMFDKIETGIKVDDSVFSIQNLER